MTKAYAYLRVSGKGQVKGDGLVLLDPAIRVDAGRTARAGFAKSLSVEQNRTDNAFESRP